MPSDLAVGGITEQLPFRVLHGTRDGAIHKPGHSQLRHVQFTLQCCVLDQWETGRSEAKTELLMELSNSIAFFFLSSDGVHHNNLKHVLAEFYELKNGCQASFVLSITNSMGREGYILSLLSNKTKKGVL